MHAWIGLEHVSELAREVRERHLALVLPLVHKRAKECVHKRVVYSSPCGSNSGVNIRAPERTTWPTRSCCCSETVLTHETVSTTGESDRYEGTPVLKKLIHGGSELRALASLRDLMSSQRGFFEVLR